MEVSAVAGELAPPTDFTRVAQAAVKVGPKQETESSAEYSDRTARLLGEAGFSRQDLVIDFGKAGSNEFAGVSYKFDADAETIRLCRGFGASRSMRVSTGKDAPAIAVVMQRRSVPRGRYAARNSFNVAVQVQMEQVTELVAVMPAAQVFKDCSAPVPLSRQVARAELAEARLLLVGGLVPPFARRSALRDPPTVNRPFDSEIDRIEVFFEPSEVVLMSRSGEVLARVPAPVKLSY